MRRLDDPASAKEGNKAYREGLERLRSKTLLPVVECRMTNVVIGKKGNSGHRINFHLIFDPVVSTDDIETFLKSLEVKDQSIGSRYADRKFLLTDCAVDFHTVRKKLSGDTTFNGKFVLWIPYDEYGGIDDINPETDKLFKENLVWHADILGSSSRKQADFFLWKDAKLVDHQLLQLRVFLLERLQALRLVETQPAVLLPPAVVRLLTDPQLLADLGRAQTAAQLHLGLA